MEYALVVNGRMVDGTLTMDVINPATGKVFAQCPRGGCGTGRAGRSRCQSSIPVVGSPGRHPDVAKVSFTDSTTTGRKVFAGGAETMKRLTLELGGNDVAIVLDDVDIKSVAPALFAPAFANSGPGQCRRWRVRRQRPPYARGSAKPCAMPSCRSRQAGAAIPWR